MSTLMTYKDIALDAEINHITSYQSALNTRLKDEWLSLLCE
jgi:hypothetical protein